MDEEGGVVPTASVPSSSWHRWWRWGKECANVIMMPENMTSGCLLSQLFERWEAIGRSSRWALAATRDPRLARAKAKAGRDSRAEGAAQRLARQRGYPPPSPRQPPHFITIPLPSPPPIPDVHVLHNAAYDLPCLDLVVLPDDHPMRSRLHLAKHPEGLTALPRAAPRSHGRELWVSGSIRHYFTCGQVSSRQFGAKYPHSIGLPGIHLARCALLGRNPSSAAAPLPSITISVRCSCPLGSRLPLLGRIFPRPPFRNRPDRSVS